MFDFKNGVLTIDTTLSVADSQALNAFADTVRNGERERIIKLLEEWPICDESCYCYPCELGETEIIRKEFKSLIALIKEKK